MYTEFLTSNVPYIAVLTKKKKDVQFAEGMWMCECYNIVICLFLVFSKDFTNNTLVTCNLQCY